MHVCIQLTQADVQAYVEVARAPPAGAQDGAQDVRTWPPKAPPAVYLMAVHPADPATCAARNVHGWTLPTIEALAAQYEPADGGWGLPHLELAQVCTCMAYMCMMCILSCVFHASR